MGANGEIWRVTLTYNAPNASIGQTVHWFEWQGPGLADSVANTEIVDWANNVWGAAWDNIAPTNASIVGVAMDVINPNGTVARNAGASTLSIAGTQSGGVDPSGVAGLLRANTALPKQRGMKYVPFVADTTTADGVFTTGGLTALGDLFTAYVADIAIIIGTELVSGLLSKTLASFVEFPGGGVVTNIPAYQRRRKPGVGA